MTVKKIIKSFLQWSAAITLGFCIVNLLCMAYERPVGWIDTPNGPSPAGWNPGAVLIHGTEGYGINKIDGNGYINPQGTLQEPFVLCMGSSHTQGKELSAGENYVSLINQQYSKASGSLAAYNIASDGNFLPSLIKHFPAAVEAFPHPAAITIEISSADFSVEELQNAMEQTTYNEHQSVKNLSSHMGLKDKLKVFIKEYLPLVSLVKSKLETSAAAPIGDAAPEAGSKADAQAALENAIAKIRSQYNGKILFIYHTQTIIEEDGTVSFAPDALFDTLQSACTENDIALLDMRPIFAEHYAQHREIPYGFSNTKPGNGHLNALGHRLIAEAVSQQIREVMA